MASNQPYGQLRVDYAIPSAQEYRVLCKEATEIEFCEILIVSKLQEEGKFI
ncbi:hypothetical protein [Paenibacillus kribbensis]|uniref:hypothetical protein n=1 Tax=Paenibacillus kribbensis TaxID=172713 RepID=UPI0021092FA8|nr:hypothetical protein [Paenibacillus kribbensis]